MCVYVSVCACVYVCVMCAGDDDHPGVFGNTMTTVQQLARRSRDISLCICAVLYHTSFSYMFSLLCKKLQNLTFCRNWVCSY